MGKFTEGYDFCLKMQNDNNYDVNRYKEELKNLINTSTYNECKEWYYGFHNAMLQVDLASLKEAFSALKEEAQKGEEVFSTLKKEVQKGLE
jgi:hypothetical protein